MFFSRSSIPIHKYLVINENLVRKPERKMQLGRPRRRQVDIIKINLRETLWSGVNWIGLA
jgi:hypothetical protein